MGPVSVWSASVYHFTEMCSGSEVGSYSRLIGSCITQLNAQGPSRTCNESKKEEEEDIPRAHGASCDESTTAKVDECFKIDFWLRFKVDF